MVKGNPACLVGNCGYPEFRFIGRRAGGVKGTSDIGIAPCEDIACAKPGDIGPGDIGYWLARAWPGGKTARYRTRAGDGEYGGGGAPEGEFID